MSFRGEAKGSQGNATCGGVRLRNLTWGGKVDTGSLSNLLTVVVFFDEVRMGDGSVCVANLRESANQLRALRLEPDLQ